MNIIYLGKDKPYAIKGLRYLIKKGFNVILVVCPSASSHSKTLYCEAKRLRLNALSDEEFHSELQAQKYKNIDLVISFLYWKKITHPLISLPQFGCINFHPAPLPDFRGVAGYNFAIYENLKEWGVSAHFVDNSFDTGDIIKVEHFQIFPEQETALSLEQKTQKRLFFLFKKIVQLFLKNKPIPRKPQTKGRYISKKEFEIARRIRDDDSAEIIERKIRAFWFPPFHGASIIIDDKEFTLVNNFILKRL